MKFIRSLTSQKKFTSVSFIFVSLTFSEYMPYCYIFRGVKLLIMFPNSLLRWHRRHLRCPQLPSINFRRPWSILSTPSWYHHHLLHLIFTKLSVPVRFVSWQSQTLYFPLGLLASPQVRYSSSSARITKYIEYKECWAIVVSCYELSVMLLRPY